MGSKNWCTNNFLVYCVSPTIHVKEAGIRLGPLEVIYPQTLQGEFKAFSNSFMIRGEEISINNTQQIFLTQIWFGEGN